MSSSAISNQDFLATTLANEKCLAHSILTLKNHTRVEILDTGVIAFIPSNSPPQGKDIVLSSGIHGNETAPIEILNEMISELLQENIQVVNRTLFIFGNPIAINQGKRFILENMNRLFSGAYADTLTMNEERKRAQKLEGYITQFYGQGGRLGKRTRLHYDLHTSIQPSEYDQFAVYPFRHGQPWSQDQLIFLAKSGISAVLLEKGPTSTLSYFSSNLFEAHAFTIELGKNRPFGQNKRIHFQKIRNTLTQLITHSKKQEMHHHLIDHLHIFKIEQTIYRTHPSFDLLFPETTKNFTAFPPNTSLAQNENTTIKTGKQKEFVIFSNANVAVGQRALLTAIPCTLSHNEMTT